jgi:hypothetical protein
MTVKLSVPQSSPSSFQVCLKSPNFVGPKECNARIAYLASQFCFNGIQSTIVFKATPQVIKKIYQLAASMQSIEFFKHISAYTTNHPKTIQFHVTVYHVQMPKAISSRLKLLELFVKFNSPNMQGALLVNWIMRGFDFKHAWLQLRPQERVQMQMSLETESKNRKCRLLSREIHLLNLQNITTLSDQEKSVFFKSCQRYRIPLNYQRKVFFEMLGHIAKTNSIHTVDTKKVVAAATKIRKWSKDEMKKFISFCNGLNFFILDLKMSLIELLKPAKDPFQTEIRQTLVQQINKGKYSVEAHISIGNRTLEDLVNGKFISRRDLFVVGARNVDRSLPEQGMLRFLSSAPPSFVAENTVIAVQLLATEALRGSQQMLKDSITVLESLNISRMPMPFFNAMAIPDSDLKFFQHFVKRIRGDHDHMLASASYEQFEAFYKQLEVDLKVNENFFKNHKETVSKVEKMQEAVPSIPGGLEVNFEELLEMFQKLNFTDKNKSDFINLEMLEMHGQSLSAEAILKRDPFTPSDLKIGMENLVNVAKSPKGYYGFPIPKNDKQGSEIVFRDYDRYLRHVIVKLRACSEKDRNTYLIWLAAAGLQCGSAHYSVAQYLYFHLVSVNFNPNLKTLKDVLVQYSVEARRGIVDDHLNRVTTETHSRVTVMRVVGKELDLPEAASYQFKDSWSDQDPHFQDQGRLERFVAACKADLNATYLINYFSQRFDGFPGAPPTIDFNFRASKVNQWFINKYPADKQILGKVYNDDVSRIRRKYIIDLLLSHGVLQLAYSSWNLFKVFKTHYWEPNAGLGVSD